MKKIFTLLAALVVGGAVASAENVVFIGETGYETLDAAVGDATDGDLIKITGDLEMKNGITPTKNNLTIEAADGVTISCLLKNKRAITLNNNVTLTVRNLNLVYTEKDASDKRLMEASKGTLIMNNCKISNFKTSKEGHGVINVSATAKLANVIFENNETPNKGDIYVTSNDKLTISGTTNGSIYADGADRNFLVDGELNPSSAIKVYVPENRTAGKVLVKNCTDLTKFDLQNDAFILKVDGNNIVTAVKPVVYIGETGYDTLNAAVDAAQEGDVIMVNGDVTIGNRVNFYTKNVTVQGKEGNTRVKLNYGLTNSIGFLVKDAVTIKNVDIVYTGTDACGKNLIESSRNESVSNGFLTLEDCEISNFITSDNKGVICAKDGGHVNLKNVTFKNCTVPQSDIFLGAEGSTIDGTTNGSIYVEGTYTFNSSSSFNPAPKATAETNSMEMAPAANAVKLYLQNHGEGNTVVIGNPNPSMFDFSHETLELAEKDGNLVLQKKTDTGIEGVEADDNAPVEYYNLNGVQVKADNMTPGVYVRRQGKNVAKVMVK